MPHLIEYRVRIWTQGSLHPAGGLEPRQAAFAAAAGDPTRLATVEADGGAGAVLAVAIGSGGGDATSWVPPTSLSDWDLDKLTVRLWHIEDSGVELGARGRPDGLLSEFHEALWEDSCGGIRLLTAEVDDDDGQPIIEAVSWYDSLEYEMALSENGWDDDAAGLVE